mmetsp:Transcript_1480/g.2303  ORF Transcript_1480/g.2303 Transcript_1480/m.2303 type:complete len:143 (-) Transcript_1480:59-487(-)
MLCESGVDNVDQQDNEGNTPLHLSCLSSLPSLVDIFLTKNAKIGVVNKEGDSAFHMACLGGSMECLKKLTNYNKNGILLTNAQGCSPLHTACQENFAEGAVFLAKNGGDVRGKNKKKETPLSISSPFLKKILEETAGEEEEE